MLHAISHGEGFPLIALHGYCLDHHVMTGCLEPIFAGRPGYRRIYPDLPGHGLSQGFSLPANADAMLDQLLAFIDQQLPDGQPFLLAGNSYGGYLARGIVHRRPAQVAGLLLICPVVYPTRADRHLRPHRVIYRDPGFVQGLSPETRALLDGMAVVQDRYCWERTQNEFMRADNPADQAFLARYQETGYGFSFPVDQLPEPFDKPSLFLAGLQDAVVGHSDLFTLTDSYPRASLAALDRAGHALQIEQSRIFAALVGEWLDRVEESRT